MKKLPKVELHAHINGSISGATMKKLIELKRSRNPDWRLSQGWESELCCDAQRSMQDAFKVFACVHEVCDSEEAIYMVTRDVIAEFAGDNVKYVELRTTPRAVPASGMTKHAYVTAVLRAIKDSAACPDLDIIVRLLLSVDRRTSVADAWDTLALAEQCNSEGEFQGLVVGLDLSGDPTQGDARLFLPVFEAAKKKGLKLSLHLAEVAGQNEETAALLTLPPDRIGHGTFLHPDCGGSQSLVDTVREKRIPIELCLTSNLVTSSVCDASDHHFGYWYSSNHPCVICTDDKGVFGTSLSREWTLVSEAFSLSKIDQWRLSAASIDAIFADQSVRETLRAKWDQLRDRFLAE